MTRRSTSLTLLTPHSAMVTSSSLPSDLDRLGDAGLAAGAEAVDDRRGRSCRSAPRARAHATRPGRNGCRRRTSPRSRRRPPRRSWAAPRSRTARRRVGGRRDWRRPARWRRSWPRPGVLHVEDALEDQLAGPEAADPFDVLPAQGRIELARPIHCASELTFSMPCTWPARLPKVLRLPRRMLRTPRPAWWRCR